MCLGFLDDGSVRRNLGSDMVLISGGLLSFADGVGFLNRISCYVIPLFYHNSVLGSMFTVDDGPILIFLDGSVQGCCYVDFFLS